MTVPGTLPQHIRKTHWFIGASAFLLHGVVFAVLLWWSWRKWPDPLVDFGRELYVPWQLTRGRVLYRDISSLFGPLSPYVNAFWMRLFGASMMTLVWCNVIIFSVTLVAIHQLLNRCTNRFAATWATLTALALCGVAQYTEFGNYNFITPYSHDATHGFALSVFALVMAHQAMRTGRRTLAGAAGAAFGLSLMTKPELPVAAGGALLVGWLCVIATKAYGDRPLRPLLGWFAFAASLPPALFVVFFQAHMGLSAAIRAVAAGWIAASNPAVVGNKFYRVSLGIDTLGRNALIMCAMFLVIGCYVAAIVLLSRTSGRGGAVPSLLRRLGIFTLLAIAPIAQLLPLGRALPLIVLTAAMVCAMEWWRLRQEDDGAIHVVGLLMWCVFALLLLGKMVLNARIVRYGFYLSLPAVTVSIVFVCWVLPRYFDRWRVVHIRDNFKGVISVVLAASLVPHFILSNRWYATKTTAIGSGGDRFYASEFVELPLDTLAPAAVEELRRRARPGDTVAVIPEGVMINYLLRLDSPLRVVNLMPPEVATFGEASILQSLAAAPPRFVVFVHKPTFEYGYPLFGTKVNYGAATMEWTRRRYRSIRVFGENPTTESGYGLEIFEKL